MSYCTECEAKEQDKAELVADVERLELHIEAMKACFRNILRYEGESSNSFVAIAARAGLGSTSASSPEKP